MYINVGLIPREASEIRPSIHGDGPKRVRVLMLGDVGSIHIKNRPVLDALQAALDEIRADMDAEAAAAIADMAPGELVEAFGA